MRLAAEVAKERTKWRADRKDYVCAKGFPAPETPTERDRTKG